MKNVRDVGYTECEKHRGESQNRGIQINDCSDDTMAVTFELVRGHFDKKFNLPKRELSEDNKAKTQCCQTFEER